MPNYQLFSLPNCEKCQEAKAFLKSINIEYSEINIGMPAGRKEWGKVVAWGYSPKKDEHGIIMPIFARVGNSGIEKVVQGPEEVKDLFAEE